MLLKPALVDPRLDVMNFLNEVVLEFPRAISFAPGRPLESLFRVDACVDAMRRYAAGSWPDLGQYGRTNGTIGELIAAHLAADEGIAVDPSAVMVTVGAQEAMAILLAGLFDARDDVLLVSDPTYIGITGLAALLGIRIVPVPSGANGVDPDDVDRAIVRVGTSGRVRAFYDVPTFNNPLGTTLSAADRVRLIEVCRRRGVLLFEDNAYGMFAYDQVPPPALKALDEDGTVVYIGSFSKTLFPGVRVGYLVADQAVPGGATLAQALSRVKSLVTVNTPPLMQAAVAAVLTETGGTLEPIVAPKRARYRTHRDTMLAALSAACGDIEGMSWNRPAGGFFLAATVPFEFGPRELRRCAAEHGVIVSPMQFFCLGCSRPRQIRLAFSYAEPSAIEEGIGRLASFVRTHVGVPAVAAT